MKVLMICTVGLEGNGIATCIESYASPLAETVQVDLLGPAGVTPQLRPHLAQKNIGLHLLPNRKEGMLRYFLALCKHLRKHHYDVVHVHGNSATMAVELLAAFLNGVKIRVAHCHTSNCEHARTHKLLSPLFKALYTDAVACSVLAGNWIFGANNFFILNNAIDVALYAFQPEVRQTTRQALGITEDTVLLGHVGRFNEAKNQKYLLELMQAPSLQNCKLLLVGGGPIWEQVVDTCRQMGLFDRVIFPGSRTDIPELLQAMDCFLFPSRWEGFGISLVEAQLNGLHCISSDQVPRETDISGDVKYLPLGDDAAWLDAIAENLRQDSRQERSCAAITTATAQGLDIRSQAAVLLQIYNKQ